MTRHQETVEVIDSLGRTTSVALIRGDYKRLLNNPRRPDGTIHQYCPPEQVESEMDRLIAMHRLYGEIAPEVEAAWLHHRFTQIHPFQDGNGRIARALATLVFIKAGWFPLVVRDRDRAKYIESLEIADDGDLNLLIKYFVFLQKSHVIHTLNIVKDVRKSTRISETIASIR